MKWLGRLLYSLLALGAGTLLVAILQPIVRSLEKDEYLTAKVELGRWAARPSETATVDISDQPGGVDPETRELAASVFDNNDAFPQAFVFIENPTSQTAENVRIRLADGGAYDALILSDDGLVTQAMNDIADIKLPDMEPGDRIKLYVWAPGGFYTSLFEANFQTFSSLGRFDVELSTPERRAYWDQDPSWADVMDDWFGLVFGTILIALLLILLITNALLERYLKKLFGNYDYYENERARYADNPNKFTPRLNGLSGTTLD